MSRPALRRRQRAAHHRLARRRQRAAQRTAATPGSASGNARPRHRRWLRWSLWGLFAATVLALLACALAAMLIYQRLPELDALLDYRPKQALRVFTADGVEIGQFGTERRTVVPITEMPKLLQEAVLATEDRRFREHVGVDPRGIVRAALTNLWQARRSQGASTITQQVARNFYLSSRKTFARKVNEALLAVKIERQLSKDQVLELYMNQIFLGHRAYGFAAAAHTYFGKTLGALSVAEIAMLAGLPQNPTHANPVTNLARARQRQALVLDRMLSAGLIDRAEREAALREPVHIRRELEAPIHAEYVADMARQLVHAQYGEAAYTEGFSVHTSLRASDQQAAYQALRKGVLDFERRQPYRGPEAEEDLPLGWAADDPATVQLLRDYADDAALRVALVSQASPSEVVATLATGEVVRVHGEGLRQVRGALHPDAPARLRIVRGSVVRLAQDLGLGGMASASLTTASTPNGAWAVRHWPELEGALVALDPSTGRVRSLVGGVDFGHNQFNHVSQAWRQPGSTFKPFIYSAALEHGLMPTSLVNDAPLSHHPWSDPLWEPQNADGRFVGAISLRQALAQSRNLPSIRLVSALGPGTVRDWATRFGFDAALQPDTLTLGLGSGSTTPLQLAAAYGVLANGGHRVAPVVIERITNARGQTIFEAPSAATLGDTTRVIPERNAFITNSLLQEVTSRGTAAKAQALLQRPDLYGKTGTTNDAVDAWFAGFQPSLVAVVWMGYDNPRSLGDKASGAGLALPVWIDFMRSALNGVDIDLPVMPPPDVAERDGDWIYREWLDRPHRSHLGFDDVTDALDAPAAAASTIPMQ